ncbi:hypothetical protein MASR1M48_17330 [Lactococcus petauri]
MSKPVAFMRNLEVDFLSLVDKGANKQRFEIFKAADAASAIVEKGCKTTAKEKADGVKKDYDDMPMIGYGMGSSFKGAMQAIETTEQLTENQYKMDEAFCVLKCVMKGVLDDESMQNKSAGLKSAIEEFKTYVVQLFDGLPVQKASELLNIGGDMSKKVEGAGASDVEKGKTTKGSANGVSQNGDQGADNRRGDTMTVDGVSKKKFGMKKSILTEALEKAKAKMNEAKKGGFPKDAMKKAELDEAIEEVAIIEEELELLEKAVGDRSEGAPATGLDTVSGNGDAASAGQDNNGGTGDTSGAVAKSDAVKKDVAGIETPDISSAQNQNVKHDVTLEGQVGGIVEQFKKTMEVSLEGVVGTMTNLLKGVEEKVSKLEEKVNKSETVVKSALSMGGLSNSLDADFEESAEVKKRREEVSKSEKDVWGGSTDGFGSLKIK